MRTEHYGVRVREKRRPRQEVESERMKKKKEIQRHRRWGNLSRRQAAFWQREILN